MNAWIVLAWFLKSMLFAEHWTSETLLIRIGANHRCIIAVSEALAM